MHRSRWSSVGTVGLVIVIVSALAVVGASCGGDDERVVVFAASSLTDVLARVEAEFESEHPGVDVVVNTAGSSSLVAQLADGAPADVLITADAETMARAIAVAPTVGDPVVLARNELVIAVERGNPLGIRSLDDLQGVVVVLAAPDVPAGAYSRSVLACAGVVLDPSSLEQSVRSVASKVALGEADAGLVYRTDISGDLDAVDVPSECQVSAEYPIVPVAESPEAARFLAFVTGPAGAAALTDAGFELP
jgi:molybdate transport system substrate-binding protein